MIWVMDESLYTEDVVERQAEMVCTNDACESYDCIYEVTEMGSNGVWMAEDPKCPMCRVAGVGA